MALGNTRISIYYSILQNPTPADLCSCRPGNRQFVRFRNLGSVGLYPIGNDHSHLYRIFAAFYSNSTPGVAIREAHSTARKTALYRARVQARLDLSYSTVHLPRYRGSLLGIPHFSRFMENFHLRVASRTPSKKAHFCVTIPEDPTVSDSVDTALHIKNSKETRKGGYMELLVEDREADADSSVLGRLHPIWCLPCRTRHDQTPCLEEIWRLGFKLEIMSEPLNAGERPSRDAYTPSPVLATHTALYHNPSESHRNLTNLSSPGRPKHNAQDSREIFKAPPQR
ncbi:hypothetical protein AG1IA_02924 [Rhizoctonia solani AG-1 IA]|uniref:Uncharacterized protein n=1 Tax=Thanatephorus cucumeris (strain AG1-IA) TaxID=983506 RepID=L8WY75_THACA|nr:hypothetical protein AG1IA_02924 [Rhizoctonia solani AG-1 IA]